jgi:cell pole-organizing protein PopZ
MKLSEDVEWVLRACERSAEAIRDRAVHALGRLQEHREDLFRATLNDIPEGMPLPILADWLEDHDRGEEAGKVREALGASQ